MKITDGTPLEIVAISEKTGRGIGSGGQLEEQAQRNPGRAQQLLASGMPKLIRYRRH